MSETAVFATALMPDGTKRQVRLWDRLPRWWNDADDARRGDWLRAFFADQLGGRVPQSLEVMVDLRDVIAVPEAKAAKP